MQVDKFDEEIFIADGKLLFSFPGTSNKTIIHVTGKEFYEIPLSVVLKLKLRKLIFIKPCCPGGIGDNCLCYKSSCGDICSKHMLKTWISYTKSESRYPRMSKEQIDQWANHGEVRNYFGDEIMKLYMRCFVISKDEDGCPEWDFVFNFDNRICVDYNSIYLNTIILTDSDSDKSIPNSDCVTKFVEYNFDKKDTVWIDFKDIADGEFGPNIPQCCTDYLDNLFDSSLSGMFIYGEENFDKIGKKMLKDKLFMFKMLNNNVKKNVKIVCNA